MQLSTTSLVVAFFCTATVQSLTLRGLGSVHHTTKELKEDKFVTDPSANVKGIFKKEGDMTFIDHDLLTLQSDDFSKEGKRKKRNAVLDPERRWPGGVIPYEISSYFNEQSRRLILSAMSEWENKTCIRFRPKLSTDQYSIFIMSGPVGVCRSFVGRLTDVTLQPQGVTLGPGCVRHNIILHELGHAIGFFHEHSRPDRDQHIEVKYDNVIPSYKNQFDIPGRTDLLGYGYDHASIMHYDGDFFGINGRDTIVSKDPSIPFGGAEELSPLDILKTNKLYSSQCGPMSTWPPISTIVPSLPTPAPPSLPTVASCGNVSNELFNGTYKSPGYPSYQHNLDCAYVIKVPEGYEIELDIHNFATEQSTGCSKDYLEIYTGTNLVSDKIVIFSKFQEDGLQTPGGRICSNSARGQDLTMSISADTIILYFHTDGSGSGHNGLHFNFTAVDVNECPNIERTYTDCHHCINLPGGFVCDCQDGYYHSAAALTCYDVNECAYDNGGCQHQCINSGGSYRCECNCGYRLRADKKSCRPDNAALCLPDGTDISCGKVSDGRMSGSFASPGYPSYQHNLDCVYVIRVPSGYGIRLTILDFDIEESVQCLKDFVEIYSRSKLINWRIQFFSNLVNHGIQARNGRMCEERGRRISLTSSREYMLIYFHTDNSGTGSRLSVEFNAQDNNECASNGGRGPCAHSCSNTMGSFVCSCRTGYSLGSDGRSCSDNNQCASNGGRGPCDHSCSNTMGSFVCSCHTGYILGSDGRSCNDDNECASNGGRGPCDHSCSNTIGSFVCSCRTGYSLGSDGQSCNDDNECASDGGRGPCAHYCSNTMGSFVCSCRTGYSLDSDGRSCNDINECASNGGRGPCAHYCSNTIGSFVCSCHTDSSLGSDERSCKGVYLSLKGVVYANNSVIPITEIGETSNTRLQCITDKMPCCGKPNKFGQWLFPDGETTVPIKASDKPFYRNRGNDGTVNLNLRNVTTDNVTIPTGLFCCVVPDANDVEHRVCANIYRPVDVSVTSSASTPLVGSEYSLTCSADTGAEKLTDPVTYQWFKNGEVVSNQTMATLSFSPLTVSDVGNYTCQVSTTVDGIIFNSSASKILTLSSVYLSLKGVVYANNSFIPVTEIGETSNTRLQCITDKRPCCGKPNKFGEWLFPGGATNVPIKALGTPFYRNRGNDGTVNLNQRNVTTDNVTIRTGLFCCVVPDANDDIQTVCANIATFSTFTMTTTPPSTTPPQTTPSTTASPPTMPPQITPSSTTASPPTMPPQTTPPLTTASPPTTPPPTTPPSTTASPTTPLQTTPPSTTASPTPPPQTTPPSTTASPPTTPPQTTPPSTTASPLTMPPQTTPPSTTASPPTMPPQTTPPSTTASTPPQTTPPSTTVSPPTTPPQTTPPSTTISPPTTPPQTTPPSTTASPPTMPPQTTPTTSPPTMPPQTTPSTTASPPTTPSQTTPSTTAFPPTTITFATTPTPPLCGGLLTTSNGTFQTPNWPETYPNNIDCEWRIELPDTDKVVEIRCEEDPFGIAGSLPDCRDFLIFYDGHSTQDTKFGPFCHFTKPSPAVMSSNKAMAVFHSGSNHSSSRRGFKCLFQSLDVSGGSLCGGTLTNASGSFQTPYWPQTYPVNINCTWTIILPDSSQRIELTFDKTFGIAGSLPTCKDKLHIYDDNNGTQHGPYCHFTVPNPPVLSSNKATVEFMAGPSHSPSRVGFKATYRSVP